MVWTIRCGQGPTLRKVISPPDSNGRAKMVDHHNVTFITFLPASCSLAVSLAFRPGPFRSRCWISLWADGCKLPGQEYATNEPAF